MEKSLSKDIPDLISLAVKLTSCYIDFAKGKTMWMLFYCSS